MSTAFSMLCLLTMGIVVSIGRWPDCCDISSSWGKSGNPTSPDESYPMQLF